MRILSVVKIEVFSIYGYDYMKKIVLRRADNQEYSIAENDFKDLYPSDFEDLYLLNLQGHLNHLPPRDKKILSTAVNLWIRNLVIRQRVEDFQLGIENKYGIQMIMRFNEIHKFSDGTLQQIDESLDYRVKEFKVNKVNPGLNTRALLVEEYEKETTDFFREQNDDIFSVTFSTSCVFDFDAIETQNIELEHKVASLIKENEHLKLVYKKLFDSIKKSRVQTQSSNVSQNEAENLQSQLSEFANKKFDKVFQKIESMKKKMFDSRIFNDFLQKSSYDSDPLKVESESGKKKIIFKNETSRFETRIKELKMTLAQQTKDFEDAKVDFSKKIDKFETYFE
ncbi:hypothetical protein Tco_0379721 [Tanacetum coccineum]